MLPVLIVSGLVVVLGLCAVAPVLAEDAGDLE
jgi:hypothetical protein